MQSTMGIQQLTLVRHGKSSWQTAGQSDHDRPLNDRGLRDAPVMAQRLVDRACIPELILCSTAVRTQQTAHYLADGLGLPREQIVLHPDLYLASPVTLVTTLLQLAPGCAHAMIIAHNPGLEDLSELLSADCETPMPTLCIRHFSYASHADLRRCLMLDDLQNTIDGSCNATPMDTAGLADGDPAAVSAPVLVFEDYPKSAQ